MTNPASISPKAHSAASAEAGVKGMRAAFAEGSAFAALRDKPGYQPDNWKAFVEFDICHALPGAWLGPVSTGDFIGFLGETLDRSHRSLIFQQFNNRHKLKAYAPDGEKAGKRDHIIGSIVATAMPSRPVNGWWSPANPQGSKEAVIHAMAVVFKLADGVDELLGEHLASREEQSVSIEVITNVPNLGILRPSTGEMKPFLDLPASWLPALIEREGGGLPQVGTLDGEQLVVVYGGGGQPVEFRGVGMTPNPAEKKFGTHIPAAKIVSIAAEQMTACAAESVPSLLTGTRLRFESGALGTVHAVATSGYAAGHRASEADPLVTIRTGGGFAQLALSAVRRRLRHA